MKAWLLSGLFLIVGLGILITGVTYMNKEKEDPGAVKIYRAASVIGAALAIGAVTYRVLI